MVGVLDLGTLSLKRNMLFSTVATENDQVTMPNIIQDSNLENLDTSELPILIMKNSLQFMRRNNNTLNWKCR